MMRGTMLALAVLVVLAGCDDPVQVGRGTSGTGTTPIAGGGGGTAPVAAPDAGPSGPGQAIDGGPPSYRDEDFVEAETNRDPFRSYVRMFVIRPPETPQRAVLLPTTGLDQMRLIAIISGVAQPRAMILDPNGVGHVVERGAYIGRPEVVQTGGAEGMPVTLNWRVDRIRPNEVVLTREDPTAPNRPPLTRVIPLHEEEPGAAPPR